MKRTITVGMICLFLLYGIVIASSLNIFGVNRFHLPKKSLTKISVYAGIGPLFTRDLSLINFRTYYQYYQNGKWQTWQQLEQPNFDSYLHYVNLGALKHSRFDSQISQQLYYVGYKPNPKEFYLSKAYQAFIKHLIYAHNNNIKPDSIAVNLQKEDRHIRIFEQLLKFKCRP